MVDDILKKSLLAKFFICIQVLWVCAIVLFVRRWGKIRMLVPAQPAYVYEEAAAKADVDKGTNAAAKVCVRKWVPYLTRNTA